MSDLQVTNTFATGDTVEAANFNTNYSDIVTYVNARNSGASTWDAMASSSGTNVPATANNSSGTQSIVQAKDNGTVVYEVFDGGIVTASGQVEGRCTKSTFQSISSDNTLVTFDTVSQVGGAYASSRLTCSTPGKYLIAGYVYIRCTGTPTDGATVVYIAKNGSSYMALPVQEVAGTIFGRTMSFRFSDILSLNQNDYIEVFANSTSAGSVPREVDSTSTSLRSYFSFSKLS